MREIQIIRGSRLIRDYKVVVVGGGAVGKSCLTMRYVQGSFSLDYDPTIEDSYTKRVTIDNEPANIEVLDTAGQEEYFAMREQYARSGEAFLLVYSITDRVSFDEMRTFHTMIMRVKERDPGDVPIVIVGNKFDLEWDRKVVEEEGRQLAEEFNCPFFETSARLGVNVDLAFDTLIREVRRINQELKGHRYSQFTTETPAIYQHRGRGTASHSSSLLESCRPGNCVIS